MTGDPAGGTPLSTEEKTFLDSVRSAKSLADLRRVTGADSEHDAYVEAKSRWRELRGKELKESEPDDGLPGDRVVVDRQEFFVHGITHADTQEERNFLREHVSQFLADGASVYCEQGIRPMYFDDMERVREIDDYRWAMYHCRNLDIDSYVQDHIEREFERDESVSADIRSVASRFRDVTFSLIESGSGVYGDLFASTLGDIASEFLMDHEHLATAEDFSSFRKSRTAARNPEKLQRLQHYYKRVFLPQPLEREWLRRHDRELEIFTHARNERMVEYTLFHASDTRPVHIITGAAHQPGIVYYLEAYRDGEWDYGPFETVP